MTAAWAPDLSGAVTRRTEYHHPRISFSPPPSCLRMKPPRRRTPAARTCISTDASSSFCGHRLHDEQKKMELATTSSKTEDKRRKAAITNEMLDQWMRESITEIVRNIGDAPFLVQKFSRDDENQPNSDSAWCSSSSSSSSAPIKREKVEGSGVCWPYVKKQWEEKQRVPEGIVLVKELPLQQEEDESKRTWGLVVQGRDMICPPACYVLNTCRVSSSVGFCTHFCLIRAQCFGESLESQLRNAWLHNGP